MPSSKEALAHLGMHPGWEQLRELARERMEREFHSLALRQMAGEDIPYHELQRRRGFFAGMKYLLDNPSLEAKRLTEELNQNGKEER